MLAPMEHELAPLVRELDLVEADGVHTGRAGDVEVLALLTTMGMTAGEEATERMLGLGVDRVLVVGIAGGVDPSTTSIGDVFVPATVIDRRTGRTYEPTFSGDLTPRGIISCGDDLITDPAALAEMAGRGVIAVDMESAAVAAVCDAAGTPWAAFRSISDFAGEGLVDAEIFEMANPDGTSDPDAMAKYLAANPEKVAVLERLARDMTVATEAAAAAAIRSCAIA
jgi:adenosylhomocysteine nucleosidase